MGFDAKCSGPDLVHHNVFFADTPNSEFRDIALGQMPNDPTIYVCAQDRGKSHVPPEIENFELILNAPPLTQRQPEQEDFERCNEITFQRLEQFGLSFHGKRARQHLTMPQDFEALFPASEGSTLRAEPKGNDVNPETPEMHNQIEQPLSGRRRGASGSGHPHGNSLRRARGRGDDKAPNFNIDVPPNGYAWWYVDGVDPTSGRAISIIAFIGSVFHLGISGQGGGNHKTTSV